jgi:hypothetical protein
MKFFFSFFLLTIGFFLQAKDYKGFFNFTTSEKTGKVTLALNQFDKEFLMVSYFATGIGSNDLGFDRGKIGAQKLVKFSRYGNRVLMHELNTQYRANSENLAEKNTVRDAFASSILYGFVIEKDTQGIVSIDLSNFLMEDWNNVVATLKDNNQGSYKLDKSRTVVEHKELLAFPKNVEFESWLTFNGEPQGQFIKSVTPSPEFVSYRQHISFVELPDAGYKPRVYHPFSGYFDLSYFDYASPINEPIEKKFILRHRLEKKNPALEKSEPVEPIIYYVDAGCPEPIRSALVEGASWWNQAYEAAGFINAFRVEVLPADAHPLDVRYNTIQWVHRSTRGWSYGSTISDPRTGEIIKGHVSLGSLRVRQDFMIAQGLLSLYEGDKKDHGPMTLMALARLRQLSAHEVGHTIGLAHNFAASINDRASVMDYPHPYVTLTNGQIEMDKSYDDKIGIWDKRAIIYGYTELNGIDEEKQLKDIIATTKALGLRYMSDPDARPDASANAEGHLWDNGTDAIEELNRIMVLRRDALNRFGTNSIVTGTPLAELEKVLVPVYYMQRYQVEAVSKLIGGSNYEYEVKGDKTNVPYTKVSFEKQQKAIAQIMATLSNDNLALNQNILNLLVPHAYGYGPNRESFKNESGYGFDEHGAALAAIDHAFNLLFNKQRLVRLHNQNVFDLTAFFKEIDKHVNTKSSMGNFVDRLKERAFVFRLIALAQAPDKYGISAIAKNHLSTKLNVLIARKNTKEVDSSHTLELIALIEKMKGDEQVIIPPSTTLPPGAPIGCTD